MTPLAMSQALHEVRLRLAKHGETDSADALAHVQAFLMEFERLERSWLETGQNTLEEIRRIKTYNRELEAENMRLRAELSWAVSK